MSGRGGGCGGHAAWEESEKAILYKHFNDVDKYSHGVDIDACIAELKALGLPSAGREARYEAGVIRTTWSRLKKKGYVPSPPDRTANTPATGRAAHAQSSPDTLVDIAKKRLPAVDNAAVKAQIELVEGLKDEVDSLGRKKDDAWKANIQRVEKEAAKQLKRKRDSGDKKIAFTFGDSEENRAYEHVSAEHASKNSRLQLEEKTLAEMKEKVERGKTEIAKLRKEHADLGAFLKELEGSAGSSSGAAGPAATPEY